MKKTAILFSLFCINMFLVSSIITVLAQDTIYYDKTTLYCANFINTTSEDIVSTELITTPDYNNDSSIRMRNANFQMITGLSLNLTDYDLVNDTTYDKNTNSTIPFTTPLFYSFPDIYLPNFKLCERNLKDKKTEFQFEMIINPFFEDSGLAYNFTFGFDFWSIFKSEITINFTNTVYCTSTDGLFEYAINQSYITIKTPFLNKIVNLNHSFFGVSQNNAQNDNKPVSVSIIFDFNSIEIIFIEPGYEYLEYQNSANITLSNEAFHFYNTNLYRYNFDSYKYFRYREMFDYIPTDLVLTELKMIYDFETHNDPLNNHVNILTDITKINLICLDSSLINPFSIYIPDLVPNMEVLQSEFIEDNMFFHNRFYEIYNLNFDTTELSSLTNPLAFNVNANNITTLQYRYIGNISYSSKESLNLYIQKSMQNISSSLYPRIVNLPTWYSQLPNFPEFYFALNKTYVKDSQRDCMHVYYQTTDKDVHWLNFNLYNTEFSIQFQPLLDQLIFDNQVIELHYQNFTFMTFDFYIYPTLRIDRKYYLTGYLEYYGQKEYFFTNREIPLENTFVFNQTMQLGLGTTANDFYFATFESVNLYYAYDSLSTEIYDVVKHYNYRCVYRTIIQKTRFIYDSVYGESSFASQLSKLRGYYVDKIAYFTETYNTQFQTNFRSETQYNFDINETVNDVSYTNNQTYLCTGSIADCSTLNGVEIQLVPNALDNGTNANLTTPTYSGLKLKKSDGFYPILFDKSYNKVPDSSLIGSVLLAIGIIGTIVAPTIIREVQHHSEPINEQTTPSNMIVFRNGIRAVGNWFEGIGNDITSGWNTVVNESNGIINNYITETVYNTVNALSQVGRELTSHFNVVVFTASTILQYEDTSNAFDIFVFLSQMIVPFLILLLFGYLAKNVHPKLTPVGLILAIVVCFVMNQFTLKTAIVLAILLMVYIYIHFKNERDFVKMGETTNA